MNDFDYDVMQKKRIARGAFHKRRGSKSTKCHLPSDYMTQAEWKRRNGPVSTFKLDAPMKWDEFTNMPEDLRRKYLEHLRTEYKATAEMMAEMFGVAAITVNKVRRALNAGPGKSCGGKMSEEAKDARAKRWYEFCNGVPAAEESAETPIIEEPIIEEPIIEEPIIEEPIVETPNKEEEKTPFSPGSVNTDDTASKAADALYDFIRGKWLHTEAEELHVSDLTATFKGKFDAVKFLNWISKLPMPEGDVNIRVEVTSR